VREAYARRYGIVLERLSSGGKIIKGVKDSQLRHRICQAAFKGVQRAIEEKARECPSCMWIQRTLPNSAQFTMPPLTTTAG